MTNLKVKLATGAATVAVLATAFAPVTFAATKSVVVKGNGKDSTNTVTLKNKNKTKVTQYNSTAVLNLTGVLQNTGFNEANGNTGGGTKSVDSGNASSTVINTTTAGVNNATVTQCACQTNGSDVTVQGNGADSTNNVTVTNKNKTVVEQGNETLVVNGTLVVQNTGANQANENTGGGNVTVDSGSATSTVTNTVVAGSNAVNL